MHRDGRALVWDIGNRLEFPRQAFLLCSQSTTEESVWNLPLIVPVRISLDCKSRHKLTVVDQSGDIFTFDLERTVNDTPLKGMVDEKRWEAGALAFLGTVRRKAAVKVAVETQNQNSKGRILMEDLFEANDLADLAEVAVPVSKERTFVAEPTHLAVSRE